MSCESLESFGYVFISENFTIFTHFRVVFWLYFLILKTLKTNAVVWYYLEDALFLIF